MFNGSLSSRLCWEQAHSLSIPHPLAEAAPLADPPFHRCQQAAHTSLVRRMYSAWLTWWLLSYLPHVSSAISPYPTHLSRLSTRHIFPSQRHFQPFQFAQASLFSQLCAIIVCHRVQKLIIYLILLLLFHTSLLLLPTRLLASWEQE